METDAQTLPSSAHAFVNSFRPLLGAFPVQPWNAADAETRSTKRCRTEVLDTQPSSSQPQGGVNIWYTSPGAQGTGDVNDISGFGTSSRSAYPPGSPYPIRPTETMSSHHFHHFPHGPGDWGLGNGMPTATSQHDAAPQQFLDTDVTGPGHTQWALHPPSPVDPIATGSSLHDWRPSAPAASALVANYRSYDQQLQGGALDSTPLPVAGAELHPSAEIPLASNNGCYPLIPEQSGYGYGVSDDQSNYQALTLGLEEPVVLDNVSTSEFSQVGSNFVTNDVLSEHGALSSLQHPAPYPSTTAPLQHVSGFAHNGPGSAAVKHPNDGQWIKQEHAAQAECDRPEFMEVKVQLTNGFGRKKRARFDECLRKETSSTRTIGACLRCHNQKIRCVPNEVDKGPFAPCLTCLRVRRDSKKILHDVPCIRFKVTSMAVYRPGGLDYTQRFDHTKVVDITDYSDDAFYDIGITQGLCRHPMRLRVRRFNPKKTDVTYRRYMDGDTHKTQDTGAFCLANVEETAKGFSRYIDCNALEGLERATKSSDGIVQAMFKMVASHCRSLPDPIKAEDRESTREAKRNPAQKDFLQKLVRLWFAIRHGTDSAWLCGKERLGLKPGLGRHHPLPDRITVPRMIVAQFDSIRCERIYKKLFPGVLRSLDTFLSSCNKEAWFTVFLATFLLLHQAAHTSRDRYRHAKENEAVNPRETRYGAIGHPLTAFVEEVHHGAVMLLTNWHYFKRCDLMNFNWEAIDGSALAFLEPNQVEFVKRIVGRVKEKLPSIPMTPEEGCWEHELFWVSKMFVSEPSRDVHWTAPEIFTRAKPSVGRE